MITPKRIGRLAGMALATLAVAALAACSANGGTVVVTTTITSNSSGDPTTVASSSAVTAPASTSGGSSTGSPTPSGTPTGTSPAGVTSSPTSTKPTKPPKPVHVSTFEGDGSTYGVGMAIMVLFSAAPTDSSGFTKAVTVTVNGKKATGAWFWQAPTVPGYKMEALYRENNYWPAHSTIDVNLPLQGVSAGPGLAYDDSLTLKFNIGAEHVSYVSNTQHNMTVTSDGNVVKNMPVSLGASITPTFDGTKVVMAKGEYVPGTRKLRPDGAVRMVSSPNSPDRYDEIVPWSVRVTNSGEFIHAASWNLVNIGNRDTSNGCTNLRPNDAEWFYNFSLPGDVVIYKDANPKGTLQPSWDGWGWWNIPWSEWSHGGELINH